jgi:phage-related protein
VNACDAPRRRVGQRCLAALLMVAALVVAGCGSSKPSYCDHLTKLKASVSGISVSGGIGSLKSQLNGIASQAKSVVSSAKNDFPNETSTIDSSISKLQTDVAAIASSPTPAQLAAAASAAKGVVTSVNGFASATKSKCQ